MIVYLMPTIYGDTVRTDVDMCMIIMVAANAFICFIEITREGW